MVPKLLGNDSGEGESVLNTQYAVTARPKEF
jgi:hypothetical protein